MTRTSTSTSSSSEQRDTESAESSSDEEQGGDSPVESDEYPSSESWEPTPQHRRSLATINDVPLAAKPSSSNNPRCARRRQGPKSESKCGSTPGIIQVRDRTVAKQHIAVSELNERTNERVGG
mmetsp:Transcript_94200/g.162896  ORF Transcript_94200/g.162896 Transcript_94200/m.162896 type:complete len:123 (-) Transcript_94200:238-606(-)